ncbi:MAG: hypothetical protein F4103_10310 [Boseongicola sp. SB0673_bin_14]|nr:hypothetical protein [Boseongicola sp. SB0667_bin_21]MYI69100.1 hypothetical protein [Boseongicola sp. SB0673_bin_14]
MNCAGPLQALCKLLKSNPGPGHARHQCRTNAFVHILLLIAAPVMAQRKVNVGESGNPGVMGDTEFAT